MTCGRELRFEWPLMLRLLGRASTHVSSSSLHVSLAGFFLRGEKGLR